MNFKWKNVILSLIRFLKIGGKLLFDCIPVFQVAEPETPSPTKPDPDSEFDPEAIVVPKLAAEELAARKPRLAGRNLTAYPPSLKDGDMSGLCSIMWDDSRLNKTIETINIKGGVAITVAISIHRYIYIFSRVKLI